MRRVILVLFVVLFLVSPQARGDNVGADTHYCDGKGQPAIGEGSIDQARVHAEVLANAFGKNCPIEPVPTFLGTSDAAGVAAIINRSRAFGGTNVPMTPIEKAQSLVNARAAFSDVHHIPLYVGGWAVAYNLPCSGPQLKLTSFNLSLMYSGLITAWDDARLLADNPWLSGCHHTVRLVRRETGAGATSVFQDYLSKENPQWNAYRRGLAGTAWPTNAFACVGLGDDGMAFCVHQVPGAIGYVEMAAARANALPVAAVQNLTRSFVAPSAAACSAAAANAVTPPGTMPVQAGGVTLPWYPATLGDWSAVSITDAPDAATGQKSYPICSFSYALVLQTWFSGYGGSVGGGVTRTVVDYLTVALMDGTQKDLEKAGYASLPAAIRAMSRAGVASISYFNFTTGGI